MKALSTVLLLTFLAACAAAADSGDRPLAAGDHALRLRVDGRVRTYLLHVPPQAARHRPLPLLVALHGGYGNGRYMQRVGFDAYADERGFLVAYPDGVERSWADGRGTTPAEEEGVDDVAFLRRLVDDVARRLPVERRRTFLTGSSNGGMMTWRVACETRGVFAGYATVIANIPEPIAAACTPRTPVPFLAINGVADPVIPVDGGDCCGNPDGPLGQGGRVLSADESIARVAAAARCAPQPAVEEIPPRVDDGTAVERRTFRGCARGARVVALRVDGMGHSWPPLEGILGAFIGPTSHNLDAAAEIVEFFFPH